MSKYIWKMFLWNNTKVLLSGSCAKLYLVLADTGTKITTSSPTKKKKKATLCITAPIYQPVQEDKNHFSFPKLNYTVSKQSYCFNNPALTFFFKISKTQY